MSIKYHLKQEISTKSKIICIDTIRYINNVLHFDYYYYFSCQLFSCKFIGTPPQVLRNLRPGSHILVIRSNGRNGGGCRRHIGRTIAFQVPE